jgi:processive 1,2-diacylglycerol beta-glucosyltransferase
MMRMTRLLRRYSDKISSRLWTNRMAQFDAPPETPATFRPRIVILSASVGAGHVRAAQAIESVLANTLPDATIAHVDVLKLTNRVFRRAYSAGYFRAVERTPHLVGILYDMLDRSGETAGAGTSARLMFERLNFTRLTKFLTTQSWDLAINTHFLPAAVLAWLRRGGKVQFPQATVVTDFDVHGMWINHPCERYFVATEETRANTIGCGVEPDRVQVTGIPIDPVFARPVDRNECAMRHGLRTDRPVVLQLAGGAGVGSIERIYRSICEIPLPLQVVVVTGKNAEARQRLQSVLVPRRHSVKILGFTSEMHELMGAADVVVSKPGGLTTAESLARGCAMVIVEPIPGQEERNADYLLESGCAIKANNLAGLTHKLGALLSDAGRLARMRQAAARCARPAAARDVAESCLDLLRVPMSHL